MNLLPCQARTYRATWKILLATGTSQQISVRGNFFVF